MEWDTLIEEGVMAVVEESVVVDVPVSTAYRPWTQFEEFPRFMEGVEQVTQTDSTHLHWVAEIAGHRSEWDAEITDQQPDRLIAWRSTSGHPNTGRVEFVPEGPQNTRVTVRFEHEPEGMTEKLGSLLGADSRQVKADLERFAGIVQSIGQETAARRGDVRDRVPGGNVGTGMN
jgi:uncharacterized membrane protein